MKISFSFVADAVRNGLSQSEINSFKWGNSPSEDAQIKGCIQNLLPHAKNSLYESGLKQNFKSVVSLIRKWVNECEDVEALELMTEQTCGLV